MSHQLLARGDPVFRIILEHVVRDLTLQGYQPRVAWGFRVPQQEYELTLRNTGNEAKAERLADYTNQRASLHLFGRAADVVDARWGWNISPYHVYWATLGGIAKSYGLVWGGDWNPPPGDVAHIQCHNRTGSCL
jgi:D-alanyl-D-alanine carboxypeptidase